jgi:hypothetical protein
MIDGDKIKYPAASKSKLNKIVNTGLLLIFKSP